MLQLNIIELQLSEKNKLQKKKKGTRKNKQKKTKGDICEGHAKL